MRASASTGSSWRSSTRIGGGPPPPAAWWASATAPPPPLPEHLVRLHDVLHDLVTDDVASPEVRDLDPVDTGEDVLHDDQAGRLPRWEVDLRDVAVHDRLGAEPQARQEHLHLLGGRVLGLLQDDERGVQRSTAQEREGGDLDRAAFHQSR